MTNVTCTAPKRRLIFNGLSIFNAEQGRIY